MASGRLGNKDDQDEQIKKEEYSKGGTAKRGEKFEEDDDYGMTSENDEDTI